MRGLQVNIQLYHFLIRGSSCEIPVPAPIITPSVLSLHERRMRLEDAAWMKIQMLEAGLEGHFRPRSPPALSGTKPANSAA
jgi:hypothetical protein